MDIKQIYTGDYYADGFSDGAKRGKAGKSKWGYTVLTRLHLANYFFNFNHSLNSYFQGYHAGHAEGLKVHLLAKTLQPDPPNGGKSMQPPKLQAATIVPPTNNRPTTSSDEPPPDDIRSYEEALEKLYQTKKTIEENRHAFHLALEKYQQKINEAKAAGMLNNYINGLRSQYEQLKIKQERMQVKLVLILEAIDQVENTLRFLIEQARR